VSQIVVDLRTNFLCVLMIVASPRECEESQDNAVLSQGINDRDQRFQTQTKPADTGSVAVEMSFSSEKVTPSTDHFRGRKDFLPVEPQGCLSFLILLGEPRFA
jgi:hypothetical protein